mgnify:CR=1 FL=1
MRACVRARARVCVLMAVMRNHMRTRLGEMEAEAEGLRATMLDMQGRHIEQINRCSLTAVKCL